MTQTVFLVILALGCLPLAVTSLRCYTCLFPAFSPRDCLSYPQDCPAGQRCLSSEAVGVKGPVTVVLYERSCSIPSLCGQSGEKYAEGINFTYSTECCDTDLCNSALVTAAPCWRGVVLGIFACSLILILG